MRKERVTCLERSRQRLCGVLMAALVDGEASIFGISPAGPRGLPRVVVGSAERAMSSAPSHR